jgi:hypothetical protein
MSRRDLVALALALALATLHTWPLARDVGGLSRHDNADTTLNTWIVAWIAHVLPRDPLGTFDAPIFHPERRTLAYSEPLLLPGVMAVPLRALGLSATAVYNLLVIIGFALSAWAMWRLVTAWTGDAWAGALAGAAYAFNAHLLTRFAHLQAIHAECVPLVLFAVDRIAARAQVRDAWTLAAGLVGVGLTSLYQLAFAAGATVIALVARVPEWRNRALSTVGIAALGAAAAATLLAPVLWQYVAVNREWGLARTLADATQYGATWRDYLATGGRVHYAWWSDRYFGSATALFPGIAVTVLALVGVWLADCDRPRTRMLIAIGALGLAMSLGPVLPGYAWLFEHVPLLQATRVSARWGMLLLTALAALAGFGLAALRRQLGVRAATGLTALALVLVTGEALRAPMAYTPTPPVPPIYAQLARIDGAVLLEFPLFPGPQANLNAPYLLAQTEHFRPIVAGYSGFSTAGYAERVADLGTFPGEAARRRIAAIGVTHVVIHMDALRGTYGQAALDALDAVPWLSRAIEDSSTRVYRVIGAGSP